MVLPSAVSSLSPPNMCFTLPMRPCEGRGGTHHPDPSRRFAAALSRPWLPLPHNALFRDPESVWRGEGGKRKPVGGGRVGTLLEHSPTWLRWWLTVGEWEEERVVCCLRSRNAKRGRHTWAAAGLTSREAHVRYSRRQTGAGAAPPCVPPCVPERGWCTQRREQWRLSPGDPGQRRCVEQSHPGASHLSTP
jgi:hypothetical protein